MSKLTALPKVGIVYNYANASDLPAKALVDAGYDGIVSAGVGNGNLYKTVFDTLATAAHNGTVNAPVGRPGLSLEDLSHNQHYYLANYHPGYDNRGCHVSGREVHKWFDNGLLAQRCLP